MFGTLRSVLAVPRSPARPLIALAVTDGEPTSGLTRSSEIISAFSELNDGLVSMYMYGVKEDANAYLMDMLTRQNRGEWSRHSGMRWRAASGIPAMAERFRDPMLSDISVAFAAASRVEAYPGRVPNLYAAAPVTIYGKCPADVKELVFAIRGLNGAQAMEDVFRLGFAAKAELGPELAKSWAQQRVYALAGRYARRPDAETMREMRNFAARFGVDVPEDGEQGKKR